MLLRPAVGAGDRKLNYGGHLGGVEGSLCMMKLSPECRDQCSRQLNAPLHQDRLAANAVDTPSCLAFSLSLHLAGAARC